MLPVVSTIPVRHMASGDILSLQVYKFIGAHPGKKVYIQSNLHGTEIVGNGVIYQLIEFLQTINDTDLFGEIWLVPVCNPMSTNQLSHIFSSARYYLSEAKDWNRIFWNYEKYADDLLEFAKSQINFEPEVIRNNYLSVIKQKFSKIEEKINSYSGVSYTEIFSYKLQSLSLDANYLIDLHSHTSQGLNYLYVFRNREESAKSFLLDFGIQFDKYDGNAFDEALIKPWLLLEDCFKQLGREIRFDVEAWTVELGTGMQMNPVSVEKGLRGIKNYLAEKEVLRIDGFPLNKSTFEEMSFKLRSQVKKYYAPTGGMIQSAVELGSRVKAGERIYQILKFNKEGKLPSVIDVSAEKDGLVYNICSNLVVNEGELVLGILE
jgi:uncharacterized protein